MAAITKPKAKSGKGAPPPVETTNNNLKVSARDKSPKRPKSNFRLQKRVQVGFVYRYVGRVQKQDIRLAEHSASRISCLR